MGVELELGLLIVIQIIGTSIFAPFEIESSPLKKIIKWMIIAALTIFLYVIIGHWSIIIPLIIPLMGLTYHIHWCRKNGIDPLKATPRKQYYKLRGWKWPEQ